jgi:hypothetical protein
MNHPAARSQILSTYIPIRSTDQRESIGQDGALNILFTLSIMPLHPTVRGTVFKTIASLLSLDNISKDAELDEARSAAARAWELLEACQIVPVRILENYHGERHITDNEALGIAFPPSSVALVRT